MLNKNERMEKLNNAGVNTSKYFTVDLDNGTTIHLIIDENGNPKVVDNKENDPILEEIITDGYVRNTKLYRRFILAQMFHMLNYVSYDGYDRGYTACLNRNYGYNYTLEMMCEEIRVLGKLEVRDVESFNEEEIILHTCMGYPTLYMKNMGYVAMVFMALVTDSFQYVPANF